MTPGLTKLTSPVLLLSRGCIPIATRLRHMADLRRWMYHVYRLHDHAGGYQSEGDHSLGVGLDGSIELIFPRLIAKREKHLRAQDNIMQITY